MFDHFTTLCMKWLKKKNFTDAVENAVLRKVDTYFKLPLKNKNYWQCVVVKVSMVTIKKSEYLEA